MVVVYEIDGVINLSVQPITLKSLWILIHKDNPTITGSIPLYFTNIRVFSHNITGIIKSPSFNFHDTIREITFSHLTLQEPIVYSSQLEKLELAFVNYHTKLDIKAPTVELVVRDCPTLEYEIEFNSSLYILSIVNSSLTSTTPSNTPPTVYFLKYITAEPFDLKLSQLSQSLVSFESNRVLIDDNNLLNSRYSYRGNEQEYSFYTQITPSAIHKYVMHVLLHDEHTFFISSVYAGILTRANSNLREFLKDKNKTTRAPLRKHFAQLNLALLCRHSRLPNELKRYLFSFLN